MNDLSLEHLNFLRQLGIAPDLAAQPLSEPRLHTPHPYQRVALTAIAAALTAVEATHLMVSSPTGSGKTVIGEHVVSRALKEGKRVAFVVPRLSLINQTVDRFKAVGLTDLGVIQARHALTNPNARIQVCGRVRQCGVIFGCS